MEVFKSLGVSLALGLLIGLQREHAESRVGGIRTFPLITLFGTLCSLLSEQFGISAIIAGFFTVFGVLAVSNILKLRGGAVEPGQTTEIAALLMFAVGAYIPHGNYSVAALVAGVTAVLLHLKDPMHRFVDKMGKRDMAAVMQFVVISLIVLPLLPHKAYGPYNVLNPYDIWRMVVLIVGLSLTGYIIYKFVGSRAGSLLGGVLGGIISSTATTISYARRSKSAPGAASLAALVIMVASTIAFARVIIEINVVAPGKTREMILPILAMLVWMGAISAALYFFSKKEKAEMPETSNPAEIKAALIFGAIYAAVLFAVGAAQHHFGQTALYGVAIISGLTDMDAITLSTAKLVEQGRVESHTGWRLILVASLANLVFKGVSAAFLASKPLTIRIAILFGLAIVGGLLIIWLWPQGWSLGAAPKKEQSLLNSGLNFSAA